MMEYLQSMPIAVLGGGVNLPCSLFLSPARRAAFSPTQVFWRAGRLVSLLTPRSPFSSYINGFMLPIDGGHPCM